MGESWVKCMAKSNICKKGDNKVLKECCEEPPGCKGVKGTFSFDCSRWSQPTNRKCYKCNVCKSAVHREVFEEWKDLKTWGPLCLMAASVALIIVELLFHLRYRSKVLEENNQEAQQQDQPRQLEERQMATLGWLRDNPIRTDYIREDF